MWKEGTIMLCSLHVKKKERTFVSSLTFYGKSEISKNWENLSLSSLSSNKRVKVVSFS